ncbi:MAG: hypothetical protein WCL11_01360 [Verrucomicrobiota bacterium]
MRADYKRFTGFWLLLTALGLAGLAGFNVLVDPAGAFPACHLKMFEPLRYLDSDRTAKAEMARRGDWQTIILGSSRSQIGFPARHPVLAHSHSCNLGLAAARFPEVVAAFDYAQQLNPLKQVILCLDLYMFCEGPRWIEDFAESRFNPDFDRFQYYCKQLIGRTATDRAWETARRKLRHYQPAVQETFGFYHFELGSGFSQRKLFERGVRARATAYPDLKADPSLLTPLRHVVQVCRDQRIDLRIAIVPPHALDVEVLHSGQGWPQFEQWKTDLVALLAEEGVEGKIGLWDFTGYAGPPSEAVPAANDMTNRMSFYLENSHFTPRVGGLILDTLFGSGGTNAFGARLDRASLKPHLARILEDRAAYVRTNATEIAWVRQILAEAAARKK